VLLVAALATSPAAAQSVARPKESPSAITTESTSSTRRIASLGALSGVYVGLATWAYFAWYHDVPDLPAFRVGGDGWFGRHTYAGGADKLGHLWANLTLSRASTELLRWGGWSRGTASAFASGLSWAFFLYVEIKDGYYYQLSPGDMAANTVGALLSAAMVNWPTLDDAIDFRVQYWPSVEYLDHLHINVAEDYSGQTYLLAMHLGAIPALRAPSWGRISRYIDLAVGFETRRYKPDAAPTVVPYQNLFVGVTLNVQGAFDDLLGGRSGGAARVSRKIGHGVFEVMNLPYTTLPIVDGTRSGRAQEPMPTAP